MKLVALKGVSVATVEPTAGERAGTSRKVDVHRLRGTIEHCFDMGPSLLLGKVMSFDRLRATVGGSSRFAPVPNLTTADPIVAQLGQTVLDHEVFTALVFDMTEPVR